MLELISLVAIGGALVSLMVWLWWQRHLHRRKAETNTLTEPGEAKTQYLSREVMFMAADKGAPPQVQPTVVLDLPEPEPEPEPDDGAGAIPTTEYLDREELLGARVPPPMPAREDLEEDATRVFNRDALPGADIER